MKEKTNIPKMVWRIAKPYHKPLIASSIFAMLFVFLEIYTPLYFAKYFDLLSAKDISQIDITYAYKILKLIFIILFARFISRRLQDFIYDYYCAGLELHFYKHAYNIALSKNHDFYTNNFSGAITQAVRKFGRASILLYQVTNTLAPFVVTWVTIIVLLTKFKVVYTLIFTGFATVFILFTIPYVKWRKKFGTQASEADTKLSGQISDSISNYNAIELYANQKFEKDRFNDISKNIAKLRFRDWISWDALFGMQALLLYGMEIILLIVATKDFFAGAISIGFLVLLRTYYGRIIGLLFEVANIFRFISDSITDIRDAIKLLGEDESLTSNLSEIAITNGEIKFENLTFSYAESNKNELEITKLTIKPKERIGLVGPSGAGKSTFTKVLLGLYKPTQGSITIDNTDINTISLHSLRKNISYVPQESVLFHRTIRENITYGKPDANMDEIIDSAKKAHAHDFITKLKDGYDTMVGERGVKLSGGERQRIAIARAILKDSPILILDEATASLDSETEAKIGQALEVLMRNKTVIAIAHRLSTIKKMNRILVLENGRITEDGTHDGLIQNQDSHYKYLWSLQASGFDAENKDSEELENEEGEY